MPHNPRIIVVGGGLSGLTLACALGKMGHNIHLILPFAPATDHLDGRSTAIMTPGLTLYDAIGLWSHLAPYAAPLKTMRIINGKQTVDFNADEVGLDQFAFNVPNGVLIEQAWGFIKTLKNVDIVYGMVDTYTTDSHHVTASLDNGTTVSGSLIIGADGHQSTIRQTAGIDIKKRDLHQRALVCTVSHPNPHHYISTETHRPGGPFTLVPLPGNNSAVVWCDTPDIINAAKAGTQDDRQRMMNDIAPNNLGALTITSPCQTWPIHAMRADQLTAPRMALVGEAAHAIAPVAAQGFNLTLRDIQILINSIQEAHKIGLDVGSRFVLSAYEKNRQVDIHARYIAVGTLNSIISSGSLPVHIVRRTGLLMMNHVPMVKKLAMKMGMTTKGKDYV